MKDIRNAKMAKAC